MRLYGKNQPSSGKMRAFEQLKNSRDYKEMAACLGVQESTATVYTIDALAAGAPLDHKRMATQKIQWTAMRVVHFIHQRNFCYICTMLF